MFEDQFEKGYESAISECLNPRQQRKKTRSSTSYIPLMEELRIIFWEPCEFLRGPRVKPSRINETKLPIDQHKTPGCFWSSNVSPFTATEP